MIKTHWQPSYTPATMPPPEIDMTARIIKPLCKTERETFDAINHTPGLSAGGLMRVTKIKSAGQCAATLLDFGEVEAAMKRTHPNQSKAGVRHYYPLGYLQHMEATA